MTGLQVQWPTPDTCWAGWRMLMCGGGGGRLVGCVRVPVALQAPHCPGCCMGDGFCSVGAPVHPGMARAGGGAGMCAGLAIHRRWREDVHPIAACRMPPASALARCATQSWWPTSTTPSCAGEATSAARTPSACRPPWARWRTPTWACWHSRAQGGHAHPACLALPWRMLLFWHGWAVARPHPLHTATEPMLASFR